jgi:hypothetical protein
MKKYKRYDHILELSINRVLEDGEPVAEVAAGHPKWRDRLASELETGLWLRKQASDLDPRPGYQAAGKQRLVSKLHPVPQRLTWLNPGSWVMPRLVLTTLIVVAAFLGSMTLAAEGSLPGDYLYAVRSSVEDLRLTFAFDAEKEAKLHRMYAQEYLVACAKAVSQGRTKDAEIALYHYEQHIAGMSRAVKALAGREHKSLDTLDFDVSQIYLQDIRIFQVLIPGAF